MLRWSLMFLVISLIAGMVGYGGLAGETAGIATILFYIFLVLFVGSILLGFASKGERMVGKNL